MKTANDFPQTVWTMPSVFRISQMMCLGVVRLVNADDGGGFRHDYYAIAKGPAGAYRAHRLEYRRAYEVGGKDFDEVARMGSVDGKPPRLVGIAAGKAMNAQKTREALFAVRAYREREREEAKPPAHPATRRRRDFMLDDVMPFGKYRGRKISDVIRVDPRYLGWLMGQMGDGLLHPSAKAEYDQRASRRASRPSPNHKSVGNGIR